MQVTIATSENLNSVQNNNVNDNSTTDDDSVKLNINLENATLGVKVTPELVEKYQQGDHLMGWFGEYCSLTIEGRRWNPEELVTNAKDYLKDIDLERKKYGILAGLSKWKELSEQGYMNLGFGENPAYVFEKEYEKQLNRL